MTGHSNWRRPPARPPADVHDVVAAEAAGDGYRAFARIAAYRRDRWIARYGTALTVDDAASPIDALLEHLADAAAAARLGSHQGIPGMALIYQALLVVGGAAAARWFRWNHPAGRTHAATRGAA